MKRNYDCIYSLGASCASANFLKKLNLRGASGPFDWVVGGSFPDRVDIICSKFEMCFNEEDFVSIDKNIADEKHVVDPKYDYYKNDKTKLQYYHDFPLGADLHDGLQVVKDKYVRRINRFTRKVCDSSSCLFIWVDFDKKLSKDDIIIYTEKLQNHFGKNIDFVFVEHEPSLGEMEFDKKNFGKNIKYYLVNLDYGNKGWEGNFKVIRMIFNGFKLKQNRFIYFWYMARSFGLRFVILLSPKRAWRRYLRDQMRDL